MINKLHFYIGDGVDPYVNLAKEKYLFDTVSEDCLLLYLWQNQNTVVIGKNQNAFSECRTELLKEEGGKLARRLSGGGAVFHDLGNLNFTFICSTENLNIKKHMEVIQKACSLAGIDTELSGRNDILASGKKFSGNAFYNSKGHSYHHGTLLISADTEKMRRYLTPPKAKLETKGIKSVKSRVVNLSELSPKLTCETMKQYLLSALETVYELPPKEHKDIDEIKISELAESFGSWEHLYGTPLPFNLSCQAQLPFGNVEIQIQATSGIIKGIQVYTDALDVELSEQIVRSLASLPLELTAINDALSETLPKEISQSVVSLFKVQLFS